MRRPLLLAVLLLVGFRPAASAHEAAPSAPLFEPPAPGSYELPPIRRVREHWLVASDGTRVALPGLGPEQVALVSFVYTSCPEACPLALAALQRVDRELARRPALAPRVRLATVSFDPPRDTPERMAEVRRHLAPRGEWRFLTAPDAAALSPVLADYGQDALRLLARDGADTGRLRHVLKVFLVDGRGDVRNIYSAGFLDPRVLLADIETLLGAP